MLQLQENFKKELSSLKDYLILVTAGAKSCHTAAIDLLNLLVKIQNTPGVYVTLNRPYEVIQRNLEIKGIDQRLIIFIDATSRTGQLKKIGSSLCIGSPEKLSDISVAMDQAVKSISSSEKFLIFDSVNTLAIFNKASTVARFVHYLAGKIREWKVKGIILTLEKETDQSLLDEITQFSDARMDFGGE
jgi:KaiC/GvpD/RAD55 family RecA-like ATPase